MSNKTVDVHGSLAGKLVKIQSIHKKTHNAHGSLEETLSKIQTIYSKSCTWQFDRKTQEKLVEKDKLQMYTAVWKKHLRKFRLYIVRDVRGSLAERLMK